MRANCHEYKCHNAKKQLLLAADATGEEMHCKFIASLMVFINQSKRLIRMSCLKTPPAILFKQTFLRNLLDFVNIT